MDVLEWTPALAVGHAEIDGQHEELFRRAGALSAAMARGDRTEVGRLFEFLEAYVALHFAAEEALMQRAAFPGHAHHKAAHDGFVVELGRLRELWYASDVATDAVAVRTTRWIADWLRTHVAETDQALASHLRAEGAA
jgi:hemerythrin-like metal-binding protein